uniref:Transmembrane protein n=1 Tax=Heterorhabditis bacteriophora TaxID=37862 RepID=A0A1I7WL35_HETBA
MTNEERESKFENTIYSNPDFDKIHLNITSFNIYTTDCSKVLIEKYRCMQYYELLVTPLYHGCLEIGLPRQSLIGLPLLPISIYLHNMNYFFLTINPIFRKKFLKVIRQPKIHKHDISNFLVCHIIYRRGDDCIILFSRQTRNRLTGEMKSTLIRVLYFGSLIIIDSFFLVKYPQFTIVELMCGGLRFLYFSKFLLENKGKLLKIMENELIFYSVGTTNRCIYSCVFSRFIVLTYSYTMVNIHYHVTTLKDVDWFHPLYYEFIFLLISPPFPYQCNLCSTIHGFSIKYSIKPVSLTLIFVKYFDVLIYVYFPNNYFY